MLKFFEDDDNCNIVIDYPIVDDDIERVDTLLESKKYLHWKITFGRIYIIDRSLITILHKAIFLNKRSVKIVTHKEKLSRYLHKLGFTTTFTSFIKDDVIQTDNFKVVLIGGSAGSSQKILEVIKNVKLQNLALVIVQHIEADKRNYFDDIAQKYTDCKVAYAEDKQQIEPKKIYLSPKDKHLLVKDGKFKIDSGAKYNYARPSISLSYESFSQEYKDALVVIQECGYLDDGVDKLESVKDNGSHIIVQNIDECQAKSMVKKAICKDIHDYIFKIDEIVDYIDFLDKDISNGNYFDYFLEMLYKRYGYDFQSYQREMVARRLNIFMIKHEIKSIKDALGVILFNRTAFKGFFLEISINVTEFFRDPSSFKKISSFIQKSYKNQHHIKIWSAGCSSGKEAYSLAILLDEMGMLNKSIIYATDFNSVILSEAQNAIYSNKAYNVAQQNYSFLRAENSLDKYVIKNDNFITVCEKIREKVLFLQHNLVIDGSFNEFDIIICKNVVIYFEANLQKTVFQLLYNSLKFGGYLVLGDSELLDMSLIDKFEQLDNSKIYKKVN